MKKIQDIVELREKVAFVLAKIAPEGNGVFVDAMNRRFGAFGGNPDMAIHDGLFKLTAEIFIRARFPNGPGPRFYPRRNAILDYLDQEFDVIQDLDEVDADRWNRVAQKIESLVERIDVPNQSKDPAP